MICKQNGTTNTSKQAKTIDDAPQGIEHRKGRIARRTVILSNHHRTNHAKNRCYGVSVQETIRAHWKKITGEEIPW